MRGIVQDLNISSTDTRIAVAVYSTAAELEVPWQQDKTSAIAGIDRMYSAFENGSAKKKSLDDFNELRWF